MVVSFINETQKHIFITGKAGTGKTTLLRQIKSRSKKRIVIAAPTGVAAINAGGVTLHSLFKLPSELIVPIMDRSLPYKTTGTVLDNLNLSADKEKLLLDIEVLVIDEVSMMRVDVIDAINHILKHVRKNSDPFGGVQVVYFGDLYQLPPVASPGEETELLKYYKSVFFFDAKVMEETKPLFIELTEVFRQTDPVFLSLLNNIRNNNPNAADLQLLASKYQPEFLQPTGEHYIRLTSHRQLADNINSTELNKLPGEQSTYQATFSGNIDVKSLPVDQELHLKLGAQVMFVRNDLRGEQRYFNGKVGTVSGLGSNHIEITFPNGQILNVEQERWEFIQYRQVENGEEFSEERTGEFRQYPLRLAWAITIHKSQGLTFDRAIIDAGNSFAAGQVYVALSRVRTLDGLILFTPIKRENLFSRAEVVSFSSKIANVESIEKVLGLEMRNDIYKYIRDAFRFNQLLQYVEHLPPSVDKFRFSSNSHFLEFALNSTSEIIKINEVAEKFIRQLDQYWQEGHEKLNKGAERLTEAASYFSRDLTVKLIVPLKDQLAQMLIKRAPKELLKFYSTLERNCGDKLKKMRECSTLWIDLMSGVEITELKERIKNQDIPVTIKVTGKTHSTNGFTGTQKTTLKMFKEGKTITEIAANRNLGIATVESHITLFVEGGHIPIEDLLLPDKVAHIQSHLTNSMLGIHEVKKILGESISYFEIRNVIAHLNYLSSDGKQNSNLTLF